MDGQEQYINHNETGINLDFSNKIPNNINNNNISSYFQELFYINEVVIRQQYKCPEMIFACTENSFKVYSPKNELLLNFQEDSNCLERLCCYTCRGYNMKINNTSKEIPLIFKGEKECTCYCFFSFGILEPEIELYLDFPNKQKLGCVRINFNNCCCAVCKSVLEIVDANNKVKYFIKPKCYCIGLNCFFYAKCCDIEYDIFQGNKIVGKIIKKGCNKCCKCWIKADDYIIKFPSEATIDDKFLLINGAILIDLLSFDFALFNCYTYYR